MGFNSLSVTSEVSWSEAADPPSGIKAELPGHPDASSEEAKGDKPAYRVYTVPTIEGFYQFSVMDIPNSTEAQLPAAIRGIRSVMEKDVGKAATVSQEETTYKGHPALDARLAAGPVVELVRVVGTDERVVVLESHGSDTSEQSLQANHQRIRDSLTIPEGG
ncbi:hypothetical protein ACFW7J_26440 [Streptomyces sp. NPDC059525]|uniref:hypothetical protein n=1 Tax=Streptomyces sp. NPDC059525 TaxID=3346857 RepID=UPI0036778832